MREFRGVRPLAYVALTTDHVGKAEIITTYQLSIEQENARLCEEIERLTAQADLLRLELEALNLKQLEGD